MRRAQICPSAIILEEILSEEDVKKQKLFDILFSIYCKLPCVWSGGGISQPFVLFKRNNLAPNWAFV